MWDFSKHVLQPKESLVTSSRSLLFFIILSIKGIGCKGKNQANVLKIFWKSSSRISCFQKTFLYEFAVLDYLPKIKKGSRSSFWCTLSACFFYKNVFYLTLFRMGLFRVAHIWKAKRLPFPKICHTYPAIRKLAQVYLTSKRSKKYINPMTHPLSSADICIFSPEISSFCYIKKYRYRLHFNA